MDQIGYSLIKDGNEVWFLGDTYGITPSVPNVIGLPNGDQVYSPYVGGTFSGYKLVPRYIENSNTTSITVSSGQVLVKRPFEVYTPNEISRRQMILGLLKEGFITSQEAVAAAQVGAIPAAVQTAFNNLTPADQVTATIAWASANVIRLNDPFVKLVISAQGITDEQINQYFREWSVL